MVNLLSESEEKVDDTQSDSEHETSLNDLHEFIDVSFYATLVSKIKSEVKLALDEFVNHDCIQNLKYTNEKNEMSSKDNKCLPDLITILNTFLRVTRYNQKTKL